MIVVFTVSAVAHEYIISGATHLMTFWAFLAMEMQIPMVVMQEILRKPFETSQLGNVMFWISFCVVGQPLATVIYTYTALKETGYTPS